MATTHLAALKITGALRFFLIGGLLCCCAAFGQNQGEKTPEGGLPPVQASPAKPRPSFNIHQDFPNLHRFAQANKDLGAPDVHEPRVVFMGDSITEYWERPANGFFTEKGYINRGIGGQTTQQMLLRFRQDVLDLQPQVVVILAGTNDIAANTGLTTVPAIEANLKSMVELAQFHHIRVVLCTVLPAVRYPWRPEIEPKDQISELNTWIRSYAKEAHIALVDLYSAMAAPDGSMRPGLSNEGVHPNASGYAVMKPLVGDAIRHELKMSDVAWR